MTNRDRLSSAPIFRNHLSTASLYLTVAVLFSGCGLFGPSETEAEFWTRMETYVTKRMDSAGSGFGVVVIHEGTVVFASGWGMANIETAIPFSPDTPTAIPDTSCWR